MSMIFSIIILIASLAPGFNQGVDLEKERAELLRLQSLERKAHFDKDAKLLVSMFAADFINVNAGKITRPSKEQSIERLQSYFDRSAFIEWDDISPPTIRISNDASMAYVIVHKRVRLRARDDKGVLKEEQTIFAWMETYEKKNGKWALTVVASTNEPKS